MMDTKILFFHEIKMVKKVKMNYIVQIDIIRLISFVLFCSLKLSSRWRYFPFPIWLKLSPDVGRVASGGSSVFISM